jgi:hypothetical protein
VHRDEFIRPSAVLLPTTSIVENRGKNYEQRAADTYAVARKLGIPVIELNLDSYDRQVTPYQRKIVRDRFSVSPSQAAQEFCESISPSKRIDD